MKKVLSLVLAIIMGLSALSAAIPAFAFNYERYTYSRGKRNGEITAHYEQDIQTAESYEGFGEVAELLKQAKSKYVSAMDNMNEAYYALIDTDKDITEAEALSSEFSSGTSGIHECYEGYGVTMSNNTDAARCRDMLIAAYRAAKDDLKKAEENGDRAKAVSALREYSNYEKTIIRIYEAVGGENARAGFEKLCGEVYKFYTRMLNTSNRLHADIQRNNDMLDAAIADVDESVVLITQAVAKARELAQTASDENKALYETFADNLEGSIPGYLGDIVIEDCDRAAYNEIDSFDLLTDELGGITLKNGYREFFEKNLLSRYFLSANSFTADGKSRELVKLGYELGETDTTQITYALGEVHPLMAEGAPYVLFEDGEGPADEAYSSSIPTAKEPGTYYVYAKFPDGINLVSKVTVKEAAPAPKPEPKPEPVKPTVPEKEANTLKAKGKKVKVSAAKLEKKKVTVKRKKAISVKGAQGTVSYKKTKGNKMISVAKNGKIIIKKGLKAGTYKIRIKVTAKGNEKYKKGSKTVIVKVVIK